MEMNSATLAGLSVYSRALSKNLRVSMSDYQHVAMVKLGYTVEGVPEANPCFMQTISRGNKRSPGEEGRGGEATERKGIGGQGKARERGAGGKGRGSEGMSSQVASSRRKR
eukprot:746889-Hanusia_phi.AAC.6